MKLYQFAWGIYPRRIHIYLKEKGITGIEMIELDVINAENRKPGYLAKNPTGTIPTLETSDGTTICQSTSIMQYLEERYPDPDMSGPTPEARAYTSALLFMINEAYNFAGICTFYGSPLFEQRRKPSNEIARAMRAEHDRVLEALETMAGDDDYLGGSTPSIADVTLFASEQFMRDLYKLRLPASCKKLEAIYNRFLQRPSAEAAPFPEFIVPLSPLRDF